MPDFFVNVEMKDLGVIKIQGLSDAVLEDFDSSVQVPAVGGRKKEVERERQGNAGDALEKAIFGVIWLERGREKPSDSSLVSPAFGGKDSPATNRCVLMIDAWGEGKGELEGLWSIQANAPG